MFSDDPRYRVILLAYGVLIILAPAVLLGLTLGFLVFTGDLILGRLTPLEFLELYVIELVVVAGFGYGLYRLTLWVAEHRLPVLLDAIEARDAVEEQGANAGGSDENHE